ncbi:M4 family metallopeptidase [Streptomyces sp. NBC_01236]|uniref:M4 family metallopeptidase n=1 Tax=Streptomyces sp. NBC_01236 TaxID=2903789 RepID=UPI002E10EC96|nr:M4 family metallopeptidase [Streptomyces sp. NBC_01236]
MDSALLAAVIGSVGGGLATGGAAWLRTRTHLRTAARLIYAELTRDSAAVAYFRQTGHWVAPTLSRRAWDSQGVVLARQRRGDTFEKVHRGYEALEVAPFIADETLSSGEREEWLRQEMARLVDAIEEIGAVAQVPQTQVQEWTARLNGTVSLRRTPPPRLGSGVVSLPLLERLSGGMVPLRIYGGPGVVLRDGQVEWVSEQENAGLVRHVVFDARGEQVLHALPVARWTGQPPTGDPAVDEAYDGLVAIDRMVREVFGRTRVLAGGGPLAAVVHYGRTSSYGGWHDCVAVLGDGNGKVFTRFTALDVVASVTWHGIDELRFFEFQGETGALANAVCDGFGLLVKQYVLGQTAEEADWVLGKELLAPDIDGVGLRSFKEPGSAYDDETLGRDPQPGHMDDYVHTEVDQGGVHINNGIPSHALYLLAISLGGHAWERAGQIWWDALTGEGMREGLLFADWARLTADAAVTRYGDDSEEHRAVLAAWEAVGVPVGSGD